MKKKPFNKNLLKISLLLLTFAFLLIQSCKKDKATLSNAELVQKAKEWFQAQKSISYSPDWDKATLTRLGNDNFIILPSNINISDALIQIKSFLVINISDAETEGNIVELFNLKGEIAYPENEIISTYLTKGDKISYPSDLSVSLLIFDLEHKFLEGNSINRGEINSKLNLLNLKDLKSQMLMRGGNDVGFGNSV